MNPERIAGFGLSLGGEVLLEAAAHDRRLAAVVSDGAARPMDGDKANPKGALEGALGWLTMQIGARRLGHEDVAVAASR